MGCWLDVRFGSKAVIPDQSAQCPLRQKRTFAILDRRLKQRGHPDLELVAGEAVERDVAVLLGKDIGNARREAVIVKAPVEQGEGQHQGVVASRLAEGGKGRVITGDEIAGLPVA